MCWSVWHLILMTKNNNVNFSRAPWRNLRNWSGSLWPIFVKQLQTASHSEKTAVWLRCMTTHEGSTHTDLLEKNVGQSATVPQSLACSWAQINGVKFRVLVSQEIIVAILHKLHHAPRQSVRPAAMKSAVHLSWKHLASSNPSLFHVVAIVRVTTCPPGCLGVVGLCILWVACSFHHHFVGYHAACVSDIIIKGIITGNVSNHMTIGTTDTANLPKCWILPLSFIFMKTSLY